MKNRKLLSLVMAIIVVCCFAFFAIGSGESTESEQKAGKVEKKAVEESTNLGDYNVVIDSCRLAKDYEGKDIVIVKYIFTNGAEEATSFMTAFDENVYQDGIGLNETVMVADDAEYSYDDQLKEIKKGATLEVEVAYDLNDSKADIEVEVKELFSFDDSVVKKTFSLTE